MIHTVGAAVSRFSCSQLAEVGALGDHRLDNAGQTSSDERREEGRPPGAGAGTALEESVENAGADRPLVRPPPPHNSSQLTGSYMYRSNLKVAVLLF